MATIVPTKLSALADVAVTQTTLTGTDTFVYVPGRSRYLVFRNPTAGALTPIIDGDGATTEYLPRVGNVSLAAGFSFGSIAAGDIRAVDLKSIEAYLAGTIAITGGTGLVAILVEE